LTEVDDPQRSISGEVERRLGLPYHIRLKRHEVGRGLVHWSAEVEELPGCEARAQTPGEAALRMQPAMAKWIAQAIRADRRVPDPRPGPSGGARSDVHPRPSARSGVTVRVAQIPLQPAAQRSVAQRWAIAVTAVVVALSALAGIVLLIVASQQG
jgi:predicted RNase H-like HicB family nuclease